MKLFGLGLAALTTFAAGPALCSTFDLQLVPLFEPTEADRQLLDEAEAVWEGAIVGYQPGIEIDALRVEIGAYGIDGPDGVLAEGGYGDLTGQAGFVLPVSGFVDFDLDDVGALDSSGDLFATLVHEIAHVMGFGTLWEANGVYLAGSGEYTGAYGLAAYRTEFDPMATFVPVERAGGDGTADGHWAEDWAGGYDEITTAYSDPDEYLSATTVLSFADLGYLPAITVADIAPVPLPAGIWLGLGAMGLLAGVSRRRA